VSSTLYAVALFFAFYPLFMDGEAFTTYYNMFVIALPISFATACIGLMGYSDVVQGNKTEHIQDTPVETPANNKVLEEIAKYKEATLATDDIATLVGKLDKISSLYLELDAANQSKVYVPANAVFKAIESKLSEVFKVTSALNCPISSTERAALLKKCDAALRVLTPSTLKKSILSTGADKDTLLFAEYLTKLKASSLALKDKDSTNLLAEAKKLTYTKGDPIPALQAILNVANNAGIGKDEQEAIQALWDGLSVEINELLALTKDDENAAARLTSFIEKLESFNYLSLPLETVQNLRLHDLKRQLVFLKEFDETSIRAMFKSPLPNEFSDLVNYYDSLRSVTKRVQEGLNIPQLTEDYVKERGSALLEIEKMAQTIIKSEDHPKIYVAGLNLLKKIKLNSSDTSPESEKIRKIATWFADTRIMKMTRYTIGNLEKRGDILNNLYSTIKMIPEGFKVSDYEVEPLTSILIHFRQYLKDAEAKFHERWIAVKGTRWFYEKSDTQKSVDSLNEINTLLTDIGFDPIGQTTLKEMNDYLTTL